MTEPKAYRGIMVSSTFSDLVDHRRDVIKAIEKLGFRATVMETSGAQTGADVIDASLGMVRDSAAFVGVISHRYGQTPECPTRNPDALSISELEFNEAMRLGRPIMLFIMGDTHPITIADVETDPDKKTKLDAFRQRAKQMRAGSSVERIYEVFNSREEFTGAAATAIGNLAQALPPNEIISKEAGEPEKVADTLETALPPGLRAVPRYLGSHEFVGRDAELNTLDDWCSEADPHPMLLFEAIGGTGKSMVAWTWLTGRAMEARDDWAGRFWFSFYEQGATMDAFCRAALAYMTGASAEEFRKQRTRALMPRLLAELEARPWLIVLDGLERILVAYHRIDAPQMRDEDAENATDQISKRHPRAAINPGDEELLQRLTAAAPSKLLVTSRLTPRALINQATMPRPGVRRKVLPGLRPADAEALFKSCGVSGNSKAVQGYLQRNCDCHPLVIGALAGLVNGYLPDRGNFDEWLADAEAGGKLGLADLDLTQRRNHILDAAILALPKPELRLLQTLSLLQGGADYATLKEFNPHLAPGSGEALQQGEGAPEVGEAQALFNQTLTELENRGLLQYDRALKRYDLHPVVRGVAAGRMGETETDEVGLQVVDYFSTRPHDPWQHAERLEDLSSGIQTVATLNRMGEFRRALAVLLDDLFDALFFNLMARSEIQTLLRPFFPQGWDGPLVDVSKGEQFLLLNLSGVIFDHYNLGLAQRLYQRALRNTLPEENAQRVRTILDNIAGTLSEQKKIKDALRLQEMALDLARATDDSEAVFSSLLGLYVSALQRHEWSSADRLWSELDPMGRDWHGDLYRPGRAEYLRADDKFRRGELANTELEKATALCRDGRNRATLCDCLLLRGEWHLSRGEEKLAIDPISEALRLHRQVGGDDPVGEALLTLAQFRSGQPVNALEVLERLDGQTGGLAALTVAEIWRELGDTERAIAAALRAHKSACGSGEPYVDRYYLDRADALLRELGETPPEVPQHDPANDEVFEWEADVRALIEKTRKEREEREQAEKDAADD